MFLRLFALSCIVLGLAACSDNMKFSVRPPECTTGEKSDCSTVRREPNAMTEEPFFKDKKK